MVIAVKYFIEPVKAILIVHVTRNIEAKLSQDKEAVDLPLR